jgi:hypothetical protein
MTGSRTRRPLVGDRSLVSGTIVSAGLAPSTVDRCPADGRVVRLRMLVWQLGRQVAEVQARYGDLAQAMLRACHAALLAELRRCRRASGGRRAADPKKLGQRLAQFPPPRPTATPRALMTSCRSSWRACRAGAHGPTGEVAARRAAVPGPSSRAEPSFQATAERRPIGRQTWANR